MSRVLVQGTGRATLAAAPEGHRREPLARSQRRAVRERTAIFGAEPLVGGIVSPLYMPPATCNPRDIGVLRLVREAGPAFEQRAPIGGSLEAYKIIQKWQDAPVESFLLLMLDTQHRLIGGAPVEITRGTLNASLVHAREVFRPAIIAGAAAVIIAHNHPSGDPQPSIEDREVTQQLVAAGRLLGIPVHDHIIVGRGRFVSFAETGMM